MTNPKAANHYTSRVGARAEIAAAIKDNHLDAARSAGLTEEDLDILITQGRIAKEADREQQEELAAIQAQRSNRKLEAADIFRREEQLKARLPAVAWRLNNDDPALARWLSALSFARYRMRDLPKAKSGDSSDAEAPEVRKVIRVTREDIPTRLEALASFCTAILQPGRDAIVVELSARALDRAWLEALRDDADALARQGRNVGHGAAATAREVEAVKAQRARWLMVRRMIRDVAQTVPALKVKLAEC